MEVIKEKGMQFGGWFKYNWINNLLFSTAIILLVMLILQTQALGFNYDSFGDWFAAWSRNLTNVLRNNAGIGIIALGMTFVIISGGIDTFLQEKIPEAEKLFDYIFINKLQFDTEGRLIGVTTTDYDFKGKATALELICQVNGIDI